MKWWVGRLALLLAALTIVSGTVSAAPAQSPARQPLSAHSPQQPPAQPPMAASGLSITPAIQDLALSPATRVARYSVQLYNHTDMPMTLRLSSRDFTTLNQTGGIAFLGSNPSDATAAHGLSSALRLDATTITLAPEESRTVTAAINDVATLAAGGHYAAIIAQTTAPPDKSSGNRIGINQAVSSLLFLETAGEGSKTLSLLPVTVNHLALTLPTSQNLVFRATGNTQTVPRGTVTISRNDRVVLRGQVNTDSGLILPGTTRLFNTPLTGNQHPWWPGHYTVTVAYQYDGALGVTSVSTQFFYVNLPALAIMISGTAAALAAVLVIRRRWRVIMLPAIGAVRRLRLRQTHHDNTSSQQSPASTGPATHSVAVTDGDSVLAEPEPQPELVDESAATGTEPAAPRDPEAAKISDKDHKKPNKQIKKTASRSKKHPKKPKQQ